MITRLIANFQSANVRDTDRDWAIIGSTEPYFGVITADRFKRENLDEENQADFFRSGESDIRHFISRMRDIFGAFEPRSALDFGCGVGRLTLPLAALTGSATGIDISPGMLAEARKHDHPGLRFLNKVPDELFDWVVSIIVLQHIPPERGYKIIEQLLNRVGPSGGVTLQIMFGRAARHEKSVGSRLVIDDAGVRPAITRWWRKRVAPGRMLMHDYDLSWIVGLFYRAGMKHLTLDHCDHGGIIGATIYARKQP
ncbi:class I SAM-dependent methyltransferase [Sphingobium sp. JS3065]|uniref:class I SAM-dependent methyltransferase n=1 Tax=Sphingobium sp. JS3065 TaxID=2970925 RepID=UPI002264CC56|nr:class I SAM-dependent methyltransferase [Sphingobium sp. JS3065]UZW55082.1 class I SAM-dependent methyltransferase [Sphingobium sp. JS3065]